MLKVNNLLKLKVSYLKSTYPDAKIGYRGSLATGIKYKTGGPFDANDFDVDAFIISDILASKFPSGTVFRDGRRFSEITKVSVELEEAFKNSFKGYRTEPGKPFTFRVWTQAEFDIKVKPFGYKLIE